MPPSAADAPAFDLDAAIVDLVSRNAVKVPPYPAVALQVEKLVKRDDYSLADLGKLVASDQSLAADALRCANSAFYARGIAATSVTAAISRIGGREMARLAVASGLGVHARRPGPLSSLKRRIWLDSLASAALCQELARKRLLDTEEAFICGLLHDFGQMIAVACIEEILETRPKAAPLSLADWLGIIDRYHVELGLVLAARWGLPALVTDAISLHHAEDLAGAASPGLVAVVKASDGIVRLLAESAFLTPADLAAEPLLTPPERELVAKVLDRLPAFIASFEGDAPAPAQGKSLIEAQAPREIISDPKTVSFPVTVTVGREARRFTAKGMATNNLMVHGKGQLPENALLQVQLEAEPPVQVWATAKLSWPEDDGHTVLLQPFALNGAAHDTWMRILAAA